MPPDQIVTVQFRPTFLEVRTERFEDATGIRVHDGVLSIDARRGEILFPLDVVERVEVTPWSPET